MIALSAKATKIVVDKFEIKEFCNQLLASKRILLSLLEHKIDNWIAFSNKYIKNLKNFETLSGFLP